MFKRGLLNVGDFYDSNVLLPFLEIEVQVILELTSSESLVGEVSFVQPLYFEGEDSSQLCALNVTSAHLISVKYSLNYSAMVVFPLIKQRRITVYTK